jgi:hypothetical protein
MENRQKVFVFKKYSFYLVQVFECVWLVFTTSLWHNRVEIPIEAKLYFRVTHNRLSIRKVETVKAL